MYWRQEYPVNPIEIVEQPVEKFDSAGLFWVDPVVISQVDDLINNTRLSTMELAVLTRENEYGVYQPMLEAALIKEDSESAEDLRLALRIGYTYGSLIAHKTAEAEGNSADRSLGDKEHGLPLANAQVFEKLSQVLPDIKNGIEEESEGAEFIPFIRLRQIELDMTNSDALAYSLMKTQDHIRSQFEINGRSELSGEESISTALQTAYYAGALVGALLFSDPKKLSLPYAEIMRGLEPGSNVLRGRIEADAGMNLLNDLDYSLSSKLAIKYIKPNKRPGYYAAIPNGFQYAPNGASLPLFIEGSLEDDLFIKIPQKDVRAIVVLTEKEDADEEPDTLAIIPNQGDDPLANLAFANDFTAAKATKIAALVTDEYVISTYHQIHPNSGVVQSLVKKIYGDKADDLKYVYRMSSQEPEKFEYSQAAKSRIAIGGLASVWAKDVPELFSSPANIDWKQGLAAEGVVVASMAAALLFGKKINQR